VFFQIIVKTMKNNLPLSPKPMKKASLMLLSFFLLAACMQYDESLAPGDHQIGNSPDLTNIESLEPGSVAGMAKRVFTAHLNSSNEVNPAGVDSQGQGQVIFTLSEDGTSIHYKLIVANIEDITQAHIHCGAEGVNGPVVVFLFGFDASGVTTNGTLAEGTITAANIIARPNSASCSGGLATFEDLLARMRNGTAYVNAHTPTYPGGEIRGQIH
jgi:hypothetical protein